MVKRFDPEDYISDEVLENSKACFDEGVIRNKNDAFHLAMSHEAKQRIFIQYILVEYERIMDKLVEAVKNATGS